MKKDFIVRRSITMIEGKPHVETYSESELVRCRDCEYRNNPLACRMESEGMHTTDDWFCADGEPKDGNGQ